MYPEYYTLFWLGTRTIDEIKGYLHYVVREMKEAWREQDLENMNVGETQYSLGGELLEMKFIAGPDSKSEEKMHIRTNHMAFLKERGHEITFAKYSLTYKNPMILWADLAPRRGFEPFVPVQQPEVGFSSTVLPESLVYGLFVESCSDKHHVEQKDLGDIHGRLCAEVEDRYSI